MGYRSQVGFVIAKKPGRDIPDFNTIDPDFQFDIVKETEDDIFYFCDHVKWYDNDTEYPLVQKVSEYLDKLKESENGDSQFMFIRLGEDDSDMECSSNYWDNSFGFGYVRKLVFDEDVGESC